MFPKRSENGLATKCRLSVLGDAADALVHKFKEQVKGLLRRHLQQLLLDSKGVQLDHGKPKQMQHLHARGRMYENGLDQRLQSLTRMFRRS